MSTYRAPARPGSFRSVITAVALATLAQAQVAAAFEVINKTGDTIEAKVYKGSFQAGNFKKEIRPDASAACSYKDRSCNPDGAQNSTLTVDIRLGSFHCTLPMYGGGYAVIYRMKRPRTPENYPSAYKCVSAYDFGDAKGNETVLAEEPDHFSDWSRDVRLVGTGDPQYDNGDKEWKRISDLTAKAMMDRVRSDTSVRGIIVAGDLTMNARTVDEYQWYRDSFSGMRRYVFDGLGNHDYAPKPTAAQTMACKSPVPLNACVDPDTIRNDVFEQQRITPKTKADNPHYSWDWHDVHFVQLNLFAGDTAFTETDFGEKVGPYDPYKSLSFLRADLAANVGGSGRPVVVVMHFPPGQTGDFWPSGRKGSMPDLWDAVAPYNTIAFLVGHNHCPPKTSPTVAAQAGCWKLPWTKPETAALKRSKWVANAPDTYPVYVLGGAMHGWWSDISITENKFTITRRNANDSTVAGAGDTDSFDIAPAAPVEKTPRPGQLVALYNPRHGRFLRFKPDSNCTVVDSDGPRAADSLPPQYTAEQFRVVDGGGGQLAFWNGGRQCFLRVTSDGAVNAGGTHDSNLPPDWSFERFQLVEVGGGTFGLYNPRHKRFLRMNPNGSVDAYNTASQPTLPAGWTYERWQFVNVGAPIVASNGKCLDVDGGAFASKAASGDVQLWSCNAQPPQNWHWDGPRLVAQNGMCLEVESQGYSGKTDGARVQQATCAGVASQLWTRDDQGRIVSSNGLCLDFSRNELKPGANRVGVWKCEEIATQKWKQS